jgi:hypothetical protein
MAHAQPPDNFGWIILQGGTAALLYYATFYLFGLSARERGLIVAKARSVFSRSRATHLPPTE